MRLTDLFPQFLRIRELSDSEAAEAGLRGTGPFFGLDPTDDLALADGLRFTDPLWAVSHPGQDGHYLGEVVHIAFEGHDPGGLISRGTDGHPTRWSVAGSGYGDLRLSPSIFVNPTGSPPGWHGFIGLYASGEVTNA